MRRWASPILIHSREKNFRISRTQQTPLSFLRKTAHSFYTYYRLFAVYDLSFRCIVTGRSCLRNASSSTREPSRSCSSHPARRRTHLAGPTCPVVTADHPRSASHEHSRPVRAATSSSARRVRRPPWLLLLTFDCNSTALRPFDDLRHDRGLLHCDPNK